MADAHGEEPFVQGFGAGGFEGGDDFCGVFFAEATWRIFCAEVEVGQRFFGEGKEIERAFRVAVAD